MKFGRPTQLVTLTLPDDVIRWLASIDEDLAWAIVKLHERSIATAKTRRIDVAGLVQLPGDRALILVRPEHFDKLKGVSLIPLSDGRAFLALDATKGVADLELAVLDRIETPTAGRAERDALNHLRGLLQKWRLEGVHFESRAIIVAKGRHGKKGAARLSAISATASGGEAGVVPPAPPGRRSRGRPET